jgi:hypothetical protein
MEKAKPLSYETWFHFNFHILVSKKDSLSGKKSCINTHTLSRVNFRVRSLPIPFYVYFSSIYDSLSWN